MFSWHKTLTKLTFYVMFNIYQKLAESNRSKYRTVWNKNGTLSNISPGHQPYWTSPYFNQLFLSETINESLRRKRISGQKQSITEA